MGKQLGYFKGDISNDPAYDVSGQTTNITVLEVVPKSSDDAGSTRTIWIAEQGGGVDDNNITMYVKTFGGSWVATSLLTDGNMTDFKDTVTSDLPDIGLYLSMSDAEISDMLTLLV